MAQRCPAVIIVIIMVIITTMGIIITMIKLLSDILSGMFHIVSIPDIVRSLRALLWFIVARATVELHQFAEPVPCCKGVNVFDKPSAEGKLAFTMPRQENDS